MASGEISNASHILVAEDDENDFFLLCRAFQKAGLRHKLIHARDGVLSKNSNDGNALQSRG